MVSGTTQTPVIPPGEPGWLPPEPAFKPIPVDRDRDDLLICMSEAVVEQAKTIAAQAAEIVELARVLRGIPRS